MYSRSRITATRTDSTRSRRPVSPDRGIPRRRDADPGCASRRIAALSGSDIYITGETESWVSVTVGADGGLTVETK